MIEIMDTVPKPWEMSTFREVGSYVLWGHLARREKLWDVTVWVARVLPASSGPLEAGDAAEGPTRHQAASNDKRIIRHKMSIVSRLRNSILENRVRQSSETQGISISYILIPLITFKKHERCLFPAPRSMTVTGLHRAQLYTSMKVYH